MQNPTSYNICSGCFTPYTSKGDCFCDPLKIRPPSINWARYLAIDPALPIIPVEGKNYPLIDSSLISKEGLILLLTFDDESLHDFYRDSPEQDI